VGLYIQYGSTNVLRMQLQSVNYDCYL